jgi:hypothetical protein
VLDVGLAGLEGKPLVYERAEGNLVVEAAVHAGHRNRAAFAAGHNRLAKYVGPIRFEHHALLDSIIRAENPRRVRLHSDRVDTSVGAETAGHLHQSLVDALVFVIDRRGSAGLLARHTQALGKAVDGDDALRPQQFGAGDGKLSHRPTAPDRHGVTRLYVAVFRRHVSGRKNIGEKQHLLVGNSVRDLERADIGERHPGVLRLAAGEAAEHVRIAEQTGGRVAEQFFRERRIGIGILAKGKQVFLAEKAIAARNREGNHHAVAGFEIVHVEPALDHFAHKLMAENVARFHRRNQAVVQMQVGAADRRPGDFDDRVAPVKNLRIGYVFDAEIVPAVPTVGFHPFLSFGFA